MTLPRRRILDVGGDEIGTAAMNVYGQPPHAQHVYLPSYYQGQMTYTRKLSVSLFLSLFHAHSTRNARSRGGGRGEGGEGHTYTRALSRWCTRVQSRTRGTTTRDRSSVVRAIIGGALTSESIGA